MNTWLAFNHFVMFQLDVHLINSFYIFAGVEKICKIRIIGTMLEALKRSFICSRNSRRPKMDFGGTPNRHKLHAQIRPCT